MSFFSVYYRRGEVAALLLYDCLRLLVESLARVFFFYLEFFGFGKLSWAWRY